MNKNSNLSKQGIFKFQLKLPRHLRNNIPNIRFSWNNKKGQVYLLAAIIISIAVIGLGSRGNWISVKPSPKVIYDLEEDLKKESYEIVDYGIYNGQDVDLLIENFIDSEFAPYFLRKTDDSNIVFVYGDKNNLKAMKYQSAISGEINAKIGANVNWQNFGTFSEEIDVVLHGDEIVVSVLDRDYFFNLRDNEMFYFIIVQKRDGEIHVEIND